MAIDIFQTDIKGFRKKRENLVSSPYIGKSIKIVCFLDLSINVKTVGLSIK